MKALKTAGTLTADYIFGKRKIEVPARRRPWKQKITISGATENNLKNITVDIPLKIMTAITGVSGSGKSTLIKTILVPALKKLYGDYSDRTGSFDKLTGDLKAITGSRIYRPKSDRKIYTLQSGYLFKGLGRYP